MSPKTPEELAAQLREATSGFVADHAMAGRVLARARASRELEGPAFVVLALAASLVLWLSVSVDASVGRGVDADLENGLSLDVSEASL
jgi:hypothetical protein